MNFIMELKHWQVFIFTGLPLIISIILPFMQSFKLLYLPVLFTILAIWIFSCILYLFFLGLGLYKVNNRNHRPSNKLFIILMVYSLCYSLLFGSTLIVGNNTLLSQNLFPSIFPFHLLALVATVYAFRFNAKLLVSYEIGENAHIANYIGEFFLFWFMPIGIWILQPRINKISHNT